MVQGIERGSLDIVNFSIYNLFILTNKFGKVRKEVDIMAKLFVGNLDYTVTSDDLKTLFSQVGTVVDAVVITDKMTGRSRGFGFVEMSSDEEVKSAIEKLNQADLKDRKISVNEARPQRDR